MSFYDLSREDQDKLRQAGVDYDLQACLEYNPQNFNILDIDRVVAVFEGEHDGNEWRWVIRLNNSAYKRHGNRFVFLQGGCDYTGWDCQSSADSEFAKTALKAAEFSKSEQFKRYSDNTFIAGVHVNLVEQIRSSKKKTWHEQKDEELNTKDLPKL